MNSELQGALLRHYRLEQGLPLAYVAKGVCAVSHLSKIETGKAAAAPDLLTPLFARLGVSYCIDEELLSRAQRKAEAVLAAFAYGRNASAAWSEAEEKLQRARFGSHYALITLAELAAYFCESGAPLSEDHVAHVRVCCDRLRAVESHLTMRERGWLRVFSSFLQETYEVKLSLLREAQTMLSLSVVGYHTLRVCYRAGKYSEVINGYEETARLALREGNARIQAHAAALLGNAYGDLGDIDAAHQAYERSLSLWQDVSSEENVFWIHYNLGAIHIELRDYDRAVEYLERWVDHPFANRFPFLHKLVIAYSMQGAGAAATPLIRRAEKLVDRSSRADCLMLETLQWMQRENFLRSQGFIEHMESLLTCLKEEGYGRGYLLFNKRFLIDAYVATRRFKKAYEMK